MLHVILSKQRRKDYIADMAPFITENVSGGTKLSEDISVNELHHSFSIIFLCGNYDAPNPGGPLTTRQPAEYS